MNILKPYMSDHAYRIRILVGALFAAIVADGIITNFLIRGNIAREGNPLLDYWIAQDKLLSIKMAGALMAALCMWRIYQRHPRIAITFSSLFLAGYVVIIYWNVLILM